MHALFWIAFVLLLIALFGPGMAAGLDPTVVLFTVALLVALVFVALAGQLADDTNEKSAN